VTNGTTGKAAAGIGLSDPASGWNAEVAHSKSGAQGEFRAFGPSGLGAQPMLVAAPGYHGINFNHAVPPGTTTAQVGYL